MSLGTRLTLKTAVLVLAVVVVAAAALWGLGGLNRDLDAALGEYDRLREDYNLMVMIEQSRSALRDSTPRPGRVREPIQRALLRLDDTAGVVDQGLAAAVRADLRDALEALDQAGPDPAASALAITGPLNAAINRLFDAADQSTARIEAIEADAQALRERVVLSVGVTAALAALLAIIVGVWQYLAVMRPLKRLQRGVERLASGDFADRLRAAGDREFVALADDFNRMADELSTLYQDLEGKVRLRSAQLAQSERLASVGFLAAGVAHEINNPLAIIAGEAELALGELSGDADHSTRRVLAAIRDEAFRCKRITQKLLSLARPGSGARETVTLRPLAEEVASMVRSLPQKERRMLVVDGDAAATAETDPAQLKQVLLNLVINALEAVEPDTGRVGVTVGAGEGKAVVTVRDNGKGIGPDAIARVFEPFYTEKKSPTTPGLGLGLSISHAIIEDLGGRLTAASDGPGAGSTFTIELPAASEGTTNA